MITVPELQATSALLDTDLVVITHANGQSEKMTGATLKSVISEDFQPKELETPLTIAGNEKETVEDALDAINKAASNIPTDPVLHYSFDEVPDCPDGTAVFFANKFTSLAGWTAANNVITAIVNQTLQLTCVNRTSLIVTHSSFTGANLSDKIVKIKIKANFVIQQIGFQLQSGSYPIYNLSKYKDDIYIGVLPNNLDAISYLYIFKGDTITENEYAQIQVLYIGDGSYSTPIIDNANGQNNATNNGGIAVQGVSGKGVLFLAGKYTTCGNYHFTNNFTVSLWVNPRNITNEKIGFIFNKPGVMVLRNGSSENNYLQIYGYFKDGRTFNTADAYGNLLPIGWHHLVIVKQDTDLKFYKNGVLVNSRILASAELVDNDNEMTLARDTNTRPQSIDDLLIFDRALSESEVMALYQNRGNTPKHYTLADYQLKQKLPAVPSTDGTYSLKCTVASGTPTYSWVAES